MYELKRICGNTQHALAGSEPAAQNAKARPAPLKLMKSKTIVLSILPRRQQDVERIGPIDAHLEKCRAGLGHDQARPWPVRRWGGHCRR